ncbi:hypothetical protein FAGAP_1893 [Fusarium agapanthi]|uniref:Uncharacterized protein n=1 Tax=Fusarium agapanthi TaxID=1803897 RepID=A0A9P5EGA9_9HYPO|nr:hypothetical protein FAGAP_1893 [Fusarium agapanthi]
MSSTIGDSPVEANVKTEASQYLQPRTLSYGGISLFHIAAAAMHLRELHSKQDRDTISTLETQVKPVMDYILQLNAKTTEERGDISLYMTIAAQDLLPEIIGAFTMGPWDLDPVESQHWSSGSLWPDKAPLSLRAAFSDGFLRFDCYRNVFHHKDRDLFQERAGMKDVFLNSFPKFPKFDDKILRMYPYMILGKIRHRYGEIMGDMWRIDPSVTSYYQGIIWSKGVWKKVLETMGNIDYRNRTGEQHEYFLYRLVPQGYPKLAFFEKLSPETLLSTVTKEFQELVVSNLEDCEAWVADHGHYNSLLRYFTLWSNKRQEQDGGTL